MIVTIDLARWPERVRAGLLAAAALVGPQCDPDGAWEGPIPDSATTVGVDPDGAHVVQTCAGNRLTIRRDLSARYEGRRTALFSGHANVVGTFWAGFLGLRADEDWDARASADRALLASIECSGLSSQDPERPWWDCVCIPAAVRS